MTKTDPRLIDKLREMARNVVPDTAPLSLCPEGAAVERIEQLDADNERLLKLVGTLRNALGAASGYLQNAAIDLQTGTRKKTAIATIEGGLRVVRAALAETDLPVYIHERG